MIKKNNIFYFLFFLSIILLFFFFFKLMFFNFYIDIKKKIKSDILNDASYLIQDSIIKNNNLFLESKKITGNENDLDFVNNVMSLFFIDSRIYRGNINFIKFKDDIFFIKEKFKLLNENQYFIQMEKVNYTSNKKKLKTDDFFVINDPKIYISGIGGAIIDKEIYIKNNSNIKIKNEKNDTFINSFSSYLNFKNEFLELFDEVKIKSDENKIEAQYLKMFFQNKKNQIERKQTIALKNVKFENKNYIGTAVVGYENNVSQVKILYGNVLIEVKKDLQKTTGEAYYCNDKENYCFIADIKKLLKNQITKKETMQMLKLLNNVIHIDTRKLLKEYKKDNLLNNKYITLELN